MLKYDEIRSIRKKARIMQKEFAELMGIPVGTWSNVELGNVRLKDEWAERAKNIFIDLGVNVDHILSTMETVKQIKEEQKSEEIKTFDPVERPQHYADRKFEVIDIMEDSMSREAFEGFLYGNVIKYIMRYKKKGNQLQDLEKARFYLNKMIELYKQQ